MQGNGKNVPIIEIDILAYAENNMYRTTNISRVERRSNDQREFYEEAREAFRNAIEKNNLF